MIATADNTTALILAGGQGRRMNYRDKGLIDWQGQPLIGHAINAVKSQLDRIAISANQNIDQYQRFGYPLIKDEISNFQGPLAGILSALKQLNCDFLLVIPCDCPAPPADLLSRLSIAINAQPDCQIAVADDGNRIQPLFGLYQKTILPMLESALKSGKNKVMQFIDENNAIHVDYSDQPEAFKNFNKPDDMQ